MADPPPNKLEVIQILRGLAATLVAGFHISGHSTQFYGEDFIAGIFLNAEVGVDLFFVISGFIIYHVNRHLAGAAAGIPVYFAKRLIRIYPILWITIGFYLAIHFTIDDPETYPKDGASILWTATLLPHDLFELLGMSEARLVVGVAWTLLFEMAFYTIFAILLLCPARYFRYAALLFILTNSGLYLIDLKIAAVFGTLPFVEFSLGMAAAMLTERRLISPALSNALFVVSTAVFLGVCFYSGTVGPNPSGAERVAIVLSCFLMVYGAASIDGTLRFPGRTFLLRMGDASYALYLCHYAIIQVAYTAMMSLGLLVSVNATLFNIALFALCLLAGLVFYQAFERPTLRYLRAKLP